MFVLTRKTSQSVSIGSEIWVQVLEIHREQVKLGFAVPPQTPVYPEEVCRRMEANTAACRPAACPLGRGSFRDPVNHGDAPSARLNAPWEQQWRGLCTAPEDPCISCDTQQGVPTIHGRAWGYYAFQRKGCRTLVLNRSTGHRVRINGAIEIAVLEVRDGEVTLGIRCPYDVSVRAEV